MTYTHISWFNEDAIRRARKENRVVWMCMSCGAGKNEKSCPNCDILMKEYIYTDDVLKEDKMLLKQIEAVELFIETHKNMPIHLIDLIKLKDICK